MHSLLPSAPPSASPQPQPAGGGDGGPRGPERRRQVDPPQPSHRPPRPPRGRCHHRRRAPRATGNFSFIIGRVKVEGYSVCCDKICQKKMTFLYSHFLSRRPIT